MSDDYIEFEKCSRSQKGHTTWFLAAFPLSILLIALFVYIYDLF